MKTLFTFFISFAAAALLSTVAVAADDILTPPPAIDGTVIEVIPTSTHDVAPHTVNGDVNTPPHGDVEYGEAGADSYAADGKKEKKGGLPQLDPTYYPSQIFWLTFMFVCMYLLFSKKILPEMSKTIEGRRLHIQEDLDSAESLKNEAEKVYEAYEKILQDARDKSSSLFVDVDQTIKKKTTKKVEGFQARAARSIAETEDKVKAAKAEAMGEMHEIAAETASIAAQKIVGISTDIKKVQTVVKKIDKKAA